MGQNLIKCSTYICHARKGIHPVSLENRKPRSSQGPLSHQLWVLPLSAIRMVFDGVFAAAPSRRWCARGHVSCALRCSFGIVAALLGLLWWGRLAGCYRDQQDGVGSIIVAESWRRCRWTAESFCASWLLYAQLCAANCAEKIHLAQEVRGEARRLAESGQSVPSGCEA